MGSTTAITPTQMMIQSTRQRRISNSLSFQNLREKRIYSDFGKHATLNLQPHQDL